MLLGGCASAPFPIYNDFSGVESASIGKARLYIFRPMFSHESRKDTPELLLNGVEIMKLEFGGYTNLTLAPGEFALQLIPSSTDSKQWLTDSKLSLEADKVYFLAIWNKVDARNGVKNFDFFMPPVLPLIFPALRTINKGTLLEFVSEDDATPYLKVMKYIAPKSQSMHFLQSQ